MSDAVENDVQQICARAKKASRVLAQAGDAARNAALTAIAGALLITVASLIGVLIGSKLASTRDSSSLQRWFVGLLVLGLYMVVRVLMRGA